MKTAVVILADPAGGDDAGRVFELLTGNDIEGVGSLASVTQLVADGYTVLTF